MIWKLLNGHFLFCALMALILAPCISQYIQLLCKSLFTNIPDLREIGWHVAEKLWHENKTGFQRLSHRDLNLCSMTKQMHRDTVSYTSVKFHQDRMKNDRKIATSGNSILCPFDLALWQSHPKMYTSLLQVIIYYFATLETDRIIDVKEIVQRRWP